jgi:agmatinase
VVVAGIAYDGSAVYRKGAALAPQRIRSLSAAIPPVTEDGRLLTGLRVADIGDLDPGPDIEAGWPAVAERLSQVPIQAFLTVLGGDHCTFISTLAAQVKRHPDLALLWVDAHPDLCDFSRGGRWTCGCALRRALDVSGLDPARVVIAAGRDYDPEELEFIAAHGVLLVPAHELAREPERAAAKIAERLSGQNVHISFDIDALDPAFAPATATERATLIGLDIVEVSPPFDSGDITTFAALKLIFEVWGMAQSRRDAGTRAAEGDGKR